MKKLFALLLGALLLCPLCLQAKEAAGENTSVQLIRNATVKIRHGGKTFLVDPMLAEQGTYPGFENTVHKELRNPLAPLPIPVEELLKGVDAVIVTHTHLDHWDDAAQKLIPKDLPLYAQNAQDAEQIRKQGFKNVKILGEDDNFQGVVLAKTKGRHGSEAMYAIPEIAKTLGETMGIVFKIPNGKTIYLAGDTIWNGDVEKTIKTHEPDIIILNTGAAALDIPAVNDDPYIIMGREDTLKAAKLAPNADIVAVHMDAINHMTVDRKTLSEYAREQGIRNRVLIPFDGETIKF